MFHGEKIFVSKLLCFLLNTTLTPKEKLITPKKVQREGERHKVDCTDVQSDSTYLDRLTQIFSVYTIFVLFGFITQTSIILFNTLTFLN